ncbi:uncharacterized protein [Branchiostoma lanceolatum]|uniref:uncharacterized protein n=1 Tax=Branchiostoma lanceolatum TaxID=7740 RepID=UPI0034518323
MHSYCYFITCSENSKFTQVSDIHQKSGPPHVRVTMAEETGLDLPTDEEMDQMKPLKLARLLQELGMSEDETDEMEKDEARAELKKRTRDIQARAEKRRRPGQTAAKILDTHNSKRRHMAELCQGIAAYLAGLDKSDKDNLKIQFDREVKDITKDVQGHLDREECPILVAGETSSGKSTFLNLLLEEDILPVAHESSTSTICEVKYGETRQAVVHLHKPTDQGQWQVVIPLDGTEEHQVELKSYMHLEGARRDDRVGWIEIFLPLPLLKGGIVLVDSPGVGESEMMDKVVADYIPKSFAFLYIIDSSRAGGVQKDRFGRLLDLYAKENAKDFDPESAMFICNKWDTVLPRDQDKLKKSTLEKLSEMWPGLKEESQVFFASTRKALGLGRILSEDFIKVLDGLDLLLPKSLDIKLETQHRLLTRLLSAALTHINVQLNVARQNLTKGAKLKRYQEAKEHPQLFQVKETQGMEELEIMLRDNLEKAKNFLSKLVRSGELKDMMTAKRLPVIAQLISSHRKMRYQDKLVELDKRSTGEDFPQLKDLYEALPNTLAHCPSFQRLITSLEKSFERKLEEVAKSLENVHQQAMASITGGTSYPVPHMEVLDVLQRPLLDIFFRGSTMSSLQRRKCKAQSSTTSILQRCWKQEPASTPLIDILMQALKSEELIAELADVQMQPQRDLMALLEDDITKMRSIMELEIDQTFKDTRSNEDIVKTYKPQRDKINSFLGQLALFHLIEMRKYQSDQGPWYDLDSITGWTDTRNKLGAGSFGDVYRVQVQWKGAETPAALKLVVVLVPNATTTSDITSKTAWEFLKEEENLR